MFSKQIRKKQKLISFVLIGACFFLRVRKDLNKEKWLKKIWEVSGLEVEEGNYLLRHVRGFQQSQKGHNTPFPSKSSEGFSHADNWTFAWCD